MKVTAEWDYDLCIWYFDLGKTSVAIPGITASKLFHSSDPNFVEINVTFVQILTDDGSIKLELKLDRLN